MYATYLNMQMRTVKKKFDLISLQHLPLLTYRNSYKTDEKGLVKTCHNCIFQHKAYIRSES